VQGKDGRVRYWLTKFAGVKEGIFPARVKCDKKLPTVYTSNRIRGLLAEADPFERIAFQLPLKLGLRAGEACHAEFSDISFAGKFFRVQSKPEYGFQVKDYEERDIPIADEFLAELWEWKKLHPGQSLIVPGEDGAPIDRFVLLDMLKVLANRAGLACGKCGACRTRRHIVKPCAQFTLHKFRRTFITGCILSGISIHTVQAYAGHVDLATTMRYLRPLSAGAGQIAVSAIDWESENFVIGL
jgi:integrase